MKFHLRLIGIIVVFAINISVAKPNVPAVQPSQTEIDAATNTAIAQGRIVPITTAGMSIPAAMKQLTSLPVTFRSRLSEWNYDITIFKMDITPSGSVVAIGCKFYIPNSPNNASIYFGSNNIAASGKNGFSGDLYILESSLSAANSAEIDDPLNKLNGETSFLEIAMPQFANNGKLGLDRNSKISFECGEFKKFQLSGYLKLSGLVTKEAPDGSTLSDTKPLMFFWGSRDVYDWQDMYFEGVTASRGFHASNVNDLGFHANAQTNIILDLSKYQSPQNLPACSLSSSTEAWQGISYDNFNLRLPTLFKLRNPKALMGQGSNLFITGNGIIGNVVGEKVFSITEGYTDEVNKFDMSLDKVTANYGCGAETMVNMTGKMRLGNCNNSSSKNKELFYNVVYNAREQRYQVLIKENETDVYKNAGITLSTGSTVSMSIAADGFKLKGALPSKPLISTTAYNQSICKTYSTTIGVAGCENLYSTWTSGEENTNSFSISPTVTTTYKVNCFDKYCINEDSDELKITVVDGLPQPTITASASNICTYQTASLTTGNCIGKTEWKLPNSTTFVEGGNQSVSYPGLTSTNTYSYTLQCNLNGCLSPESTQAVTVNPTPSAPTLSSSATNNTIDRNGSVTLYGGCAANQTIYWDNLTQGTVTLASTKTYSAFCRDNVTGCQTQNHASITINVLYFPPTAPNSLNFSNIDKNSLTLNWNDASNNESGFKVFRSTSNSFSGASEIANLGANTTSYNVGNLSESTTYYFWVMAYNQYDTGISSDGSATTNSSSPTPPTDPIVPIGCNTASPNITANPTSITAGNTVNVTANCGSNSVVWLSPSGFNGGDATLEATTSFSAKCRESNGCESGASSISVAVNALGCTPPSAPSISANRTSICSGNEVTLSATGCDGTITWSGGGSSVVSPTLTTSYTATCTVNGCTSGSSSPVEINIVTPSNPSVTLSKSTITAGETVSVSASCNTGNLVWTAPNNFSGGDVTLNSTTTYSAKCTIYNGCESPVDSKTVTVNPVGCTKPSAPTVGEDLTICNGQSATLSASGCDGGTINWPNGSQTVTPNETNYYTVTCSKDGCTSDASNRIMVTVNNCASLPDPWINCSRTTICEGATTKLEAMNCTGTPHWSKVDPLAVSVSPTSESYSVGAGKYTLYCEKDGIKSTTAEIEIKSVTIPSIPTNPYADATTLYNNETTTLHATSPASNVSVIWVKNDAYFGSGENVSGAGQGIYKARSVVGGCDSDYTTTISISEATTVNTFTLKHSTGILNITVLFTFYGYGSNLSVNDKLYINSTCTTVWDGTIKVYDAKNCYYTISNGTITVVDCKYDN